jgi:hypothetical protein
MTPMDKNPRHLTLTVADVDVSLERHKDGDFITLQFAGRLLPSTKDRIEQALKRGEFRITEKRMA